MLFVITAFDRPGALESRLQVRPAHLDYLKSRAAQVRVGGPLLNAHEQPSGSLLIVEAHDRAATEIRPWRAALGSCRG